MSFGGLTLQVLSGFWGIERPKSPPICRDVCRDRNDKQQLLPGGDGDYQIGRSMDYLGFEIRSGDRGA